ncbi:MAG: 4Fe-4S binding protein [Elusimicrobiota bacterium]|nr:4Fe-4S binding protein [Elusimicrobiota bacterium]
MKKIIFVDPQKCLACKSCELACAVEHSESKILEKAIEEYPLPEKRIFVEQISDLLTIYNLPITLPLQCRHCEDAPCVKICPTKALEKIDPDSPVTIKNELCIGCKWCILVCPFGVIKLNLQGKAIIKCDLCIDRVKEGKEPACVSACPTRALKYKSVDEITSVTRKAALKKYLVEISGGK